MQAKRRNEKHSTWDASERSLAYAGKRRKPTVKFWRKQTSRAFSPYYVRGDSSGWVMWLAWTMTGFQSGCRMIKWQLASGQEEVQEQRVQVRHYSADLETTGMEISCNNRHDALWEHNHLRFPRWAPKEERKHHPTLRYMPDLQNSAADVSLPTLAGSVMKEVARHDMVTMSCLERLLRGKVPSYIT